jgi:hypothetical protein
MTTSTKARKESTSVPAEEKKRESSRGPEKVFRQNDVSAAGFGGQWREVMEGTWMEGWPRKAFYPGGVLCATS